MQATEVICVIYFCMGNIPFETQMTEMFLPPHLVSQYAANRP